MIDYKQYIEEHKDFPIEGINYLDLNPIYKNSILTSKFINKKICILPCSSTYVKLQYILILISMIQKLGQKSMSISRCDWSFNF